MLGGWFKICRMTCRSLPIVPTRKSNNTNKKRNDAFKMCLDKKKKKTLVYGAKQNIASGQCLHFIIIK